MGPGELWTGNSVPVSPDTIFSLEVDLSQVFVTGMESNPISVLNGYRNVISSRTIHTQVIKAAHL